MTTDHLTDDDRAFLARPLFGFLTVAGGPTPAQPRPVWFEVTADGTVALFTDPGSPKVRRLRDDPRASLVVAAPVGETERWVAVTGTVTLHDDGARDLVDRLFDRYWGAAAADRAQERAGMLDTTFLRVLLTPTRVRRFVN